MLSSFTVSIHQVELLSGHDKGKQGVVQAIDQDVSTVYVKGLNTVSMVPRLLLNLS